MDAGVSTALVHYHFATREALLAEALEHSFEIAGDTRTLDTGEGPAVQRLRDMIEQCLPLPGAQERDWVLWVELWLRAVRHPELRPTAAKLYARMHDWFVEAIESGDFAPCDAHRVADRMLALLDGLGAARAARRSRDADRAGARGGVGRTRAGARCCVPRAPRVGFLNRGSENHMSPRPSTAHLRRPAILTAAAEVISERGVSNTRISDVAERAGTSAPGVLYWFPTKDELLAEALQFSDDRFYVGLTDELARLGTAAERLGRLIELWPAEGDGETTLWMELWVRALRDPQLARTRERLDRRWREAIADIVRDGQADGEFGDADADDVALFLSALMDGFAIQLALGDPAVTADDRQAALPGAGRGAPAMRAITHGA